MQTQEQEEGCGGVGEWREGWVLAESSELPCVEVCCSVLQCVADTATHHYVSRPAASHEIKKGHTE